jgi:hypothetical protein
VSQCLGARDELPPLSRHLQGGDHHRRARGGRHQLSMGSAPGAPCGKTQSDRCEGGEPRARPDDTIHRANVRREHVSSSLGGRQLATGPILMVVVVPPLQGQKAT